jgi:hypothetical protein
MARLDVRAVGTSVFDFELPRFGYTCIKAKIDFYFKDHKATGAHTVSRLQCDWRSFLRDPAHSRPNEVVLEMYTLRRLSELLLLV